jgi:NADPH:quinone reductase-like Zn-dependent oxidoreductase
MKAYTISKYSKNEPLKLSEMAIPRINEFEVLLEIHASSINPLDVRIKNGEFKLTLPYKFPLILGHDVAGIITKVGSKVSRFKVGNEIFARVADFRIGTFSEYIAINENDIALKPKNISMEEAASIPLVGLTAWQAFVEKAKISKGHKVFIQAGSGGVGTIAIQLAKHLGATVATTVSATSFDLVKKLGADIVIDYKKEDFETILQDYDLVLHSHDTEILKKSMRILKSGGKAISISGPPNITFAKEAKLSGVMMVVIFFLSRGITKLAKKLKLEYSFLYMKANGKQLSEISSLIESGAIHPIVDKIFPFEQANEALDYVASGRAKGKVVIRIK